ncbi:MAG TPA: tetratricopeptide repeat protein, partial [Micromonosporaceae bacterium]
ALHPFVVLIRALIDTEPGDIELAVRLSTVASALGASAEGASWCDHAAELTPGPLGWTLLGHALRDAQRFDEAITAWTRAADNDPGNAEIRVVLAKTLIERDRTVDGQRWLDAALAADPGHVAARMLTQVLDYRRTGAIGPLIAAVDDAVASDLPQLALDVLALGCDQRRWLHLIPMPTETVVSVINRIATRRAQGGSVTVTRAAIAAIEPPSAVAAATSFLSGLRVQVLRCPPPDLRIPLREGTHRVWTYGRDTTPHPAVDRPPAAASEALRTVGDLPWRSPVDAFARSAGLASLTPADLLGLLGHMPPHPDNVRWNKAITNPGYWPRLAAGWICLGLLHHEPDEAWASSTRRRILVDLAFGIEDWVADSAVFALIAAAWMDPSVRADVHSLVLERFMAARKTDYRRVCTIAPSLAALVLITPGVTGKEARLARNLIARSAKPPKTRWAYVVRRVGAVLGR